MLISCGAVKDITYLQVEGLLTKTSVTDTFELHIQADDLLNITVSSIESELTAPFVLSNVQGAQGFLVDKDGYINYPVLGKIKVLGLTRRDLIDLLQRRLLKEGYIKDPIVMVNIANFNITVLGEVNSPGNYRIDKERINLFEAIGMARDLTLFGRRDRVAVIREVEGVRTILYHDLRSIDVMQSPFFYLKQNDMIYVEPNRVRAESSSQSQFSYIGTWISLISFLSSMGVILFN